MPLPTVGDAFATYDSTGWNPISCTLVTDYSTSYPKEARIAGCLVGVLGAQIMKRQGHDISKHSIVRRLAEHFVAEDFDIELKELISLEHGFDYGWDVGWDISQGPLPDFLLERRDPAWVRGVEIAFAIRKRYEGASRA